MGILWQILNIIWLIFIVSNSQILKKSNHLVTLLVDNLKSISAGKVLERGVVCKMEGGLL